MIREKNIDNYLIGRYGQSNSGPVLMCVGGIHGNELAGIYAIEVVLKKLNHTYPSSFKGEFVGLNGNLSALKKGVRYIDRDMNRNWDYNRLKRALSVELIDAVTEDKEMAGLYNQLKIILNRAQTPQVYFIDLHTSTASGSPFICIGDTLANRNFAMNFSIPIILGLEEHLENPLMEFMTGMGCISMGVEGGQQDDPSAIENLESVIWIALSNTGMMSNNEIPDLHSHIARLRKAGKELPRFIEIRHRHEINSDDRFLMKPGYDNFKPINSGEQIASDKSGAINTNLSGRIILPLYQGIGNDGFFVGIEISPFWLKISAVLRKLQLSFLITILPGVTRHTELKNTLVISKKIARWYSIEIFHLFGYRKIREMEKDYIISKRIHGDNNFV